MAKASEVIKIANNEVGYLEKASNKNLDSKTGNAGSANYTKYANEIDTKYPTFYNGKKNGYSWCDIFVDWCFINAFGVKTAKSLLCQADKSSGAGCKYSAQYYKDKKQFYKNPKVGDQIFFKGSDGEPCHTGLVYKVDKTYVYTIEGNTSSASGVIANGGAVAKKSYSLTNARIYGYGRPKYDKETATATATTTKPATTTSSTTEAKFNSDYKNGKTYKVSAISGLNLRKGYGTKFASLGVLSKGVKVTWYGYYKSVDGSIWKKVQVSSGSLKGKVGYVCAKYLV